MSEEKNNKSESQPEEELRCDDKQYKLLKKCSDKGDMTEWNQWRKTNLIEEIWLQGANFWDAHLRGANLEKADLQGAKLREANLQEANLWAAKLQGAKLEKTNLHGADLGGAKLQWAKLEKAKLQGAKLWGANLQGADLGGAKMQGADLRYAKLQGADLGAANLQRAKLEKANLQGADLGGANLQGANLEKADLQGAKLLWGAKLQGADLGGAKLQGAKLREAILQGAKLWGANLQGADLGGAKLQWAKLWGANLQGAKLEKAELQGASFKEAIVDNSTSILRCYVDRDTDFRDMSLDSLRSESGTKYLLKYNIRRLNWQEWYEDHPLLKWLVKTFWAISDYGRSTGRVVGTFFILALLFAAVYANCAYWWPPGAVSYLAVEPHFPLWHYFILVLLRPVYFSIVTMTTLGFGDMHAHVQSVLGHILLTIQVILGYVLLGALVTRLAVLFTADGPEGSFTEMSEETKQLLEKLKKDEQNK